MAEVDDRRPTQAHRSHVADAWREAQDAEAAAYVGERVDRIIKSGERDDEMAHNDEDKLLADLVDSYAPPEVKAHVARLAAAPFARWCA
ncbi:hypothetical protein [Gordonia sp. (in: high G+C Gram-positive bacteria)]|uniref:hypothetical protein n=1 Tax=Gordonia sp. (in: high G+C Gram-positive bacteria) TaxID=84139 RepID=UPI0033421CFB